MKIEVTQLDIDKGRVFWLEGQSDGGKCPVYHAMFRALKKQLHVAKEYFYLQPYTDRTFDLPQEAISAIVKYDATGEMEPFTFEVDYDAEDRKGRKKGKRKA